MRNNNKPPADWLGVCAHLSDLRDSFCFDGNEGAELELPGEVWNALLHEGNGTVCDSVEGEVFAGANVLSWVNLGSALTNDDFANLNLSTVGTLDSKAFCLGIAAISCGALGEFMSHTWGKCRTPITVIGAANVG